MFSSIGNLSNLQYLTRNAMQIAASSLKAGSKGLSLSQQRVTRSVLLGLTDLRVLQMTESIVARNVQPALLRTLKLCRTALSLSLPHLRWQCLSKLWRTALSLSLPHLRWLELAGVDCATSLLVLEVVLPTLLQCCLSLVLMLNECHALSVNTYARCCMQPAVQMGAVSIVLSHLIAEPGSALLTHQSLH
jgi:hypothetical protein